MKYSEMRVDFLGAARVIDNFIDGTMEPYSYEDYLRDFINHSDYFLQKSNGKPYSNPFRSQMENVTVFRICIHLILSSLHLNQSYKRLKSFHHQSKKSCPVL